MRDCAAGGLRRTSIIRHQEEGPVVRIKKVFGRGHEEVAQGVVAVMQLLQEAL